MERNHKVEFEKMPPLPNSQNSAQLQAQPLAAPQLKSKRKYAPKVKTPFKVVLPKCSARLEAPVAVQESMVKDADIDTTFQDKLDAAAALYARWEYEDKSEFVNGEDMIL